MNYNTSFTPEIIAEVRQNALAMALDKSLDKSQFVTVSSTNRKLNELADMLGLSKSQVLAVNVLSGTTCPFADICKAWAVETEDGLRLQVGENCEFVCYMAKLEVTYTNVYNAAKHNTEMIRNISRERDVVKLATLLLASIYRKSSVIRKKGGIVRWHAGGDFFTKTYTEAAYLVALAAPEITFFGYSKNPWAVQYLTNNDNAYMVYSHGGKYDAQADELGIPQSYVKCDESQYQGIPVACPTSMRPDDYFFILSQKSFAINVH